MTPEILWIKDNNLPRIELVFHESGPTCGSQSIFYKWAEGGAEDLCFWPLTRSCRLHAEKLHRVQIKNSQTISHLLWDVFQH